MGLFSKDRKTVTTNTADNRVAATDQAIVTQDGQSGVGDNVLNLGPDANQGGITVKGSTGSGASTTNITTSDPDLFRDALEAIERQTEGFSESLVGVQAQNTSLVDGVLAKLTELAESKQTDGESKRDQVFMWIALGLLAVAGIYFWRRR